MTAHFDPRRQVSVEDNARYQDDDIAEELKKPDCEEIAGYASWADYCSHGVCSSEIEGFEGFDF